MNGPTILSPGQPRNEVNREAWYLMAFAAPALFGLHFLAGTSAVALAVTLGAATAQVGVVQLRCPRLEDGLGRANRVTLLRGFIVALLGGFLFAPEVFVDHGTWLAGLVLLALGLDGLDGYLARRHAEVSDFGARFDMEVDAALMLVLSAALVLSGQFGPWVLAIGLLRYLFMAVGLALTWIARPLPDRFRRKFVCVVQVVALLAALVPFLPESLRTAALALALMALLASFATDLLWLYRARGQAPS